MVLSGDSVEKGSRDGREFSRFVLKWTNQLAVREHDRIVR